MSWDETDPVDIPEATASFADFFPGSLKFNATMHNGTHYLVHNCTIRPARGTCSTPISGGTGLMKDLNCTRDSWMDPIPAVIEGPVTGFYAIIWAFEQIFNGSAAAGGPKMVAASNSIFIDATASFTTNGVIVGPPDMLSHVQRTLWHMPINARPARVPANQTGGRFDLNSTVDMVVNSESLVLMIKINYTIIGTVVGVAVLLGISAVVYLIVAENEGLGRLMRDSLVHSLTVAGVQGPGIPNACMAGLQTVLDVVGKEKLVYEVVTQAIPGYLGHLAIQNASIPRIRYTLPMSGYWYGAQKKATEKENPGSDKCKE